jgi:hypothetical protein
VSNLKQAVDDFEQDLLRWKQVITMGGSIEPYKMIVAAIKVSSVILTEYPKMADELDNLRAEVAALKEQNGWISVKDRMPDSGTWVSVWARGINHDCSPAGAWTFSTALLDEGGEWLHSFYSPDVEVSHWRKIPEPPKEGEA